MNTDIRVAISFYKHLKRRRLQLDLGAEGVCGLIDLWLYMAENRPDGNLSNMSSEEISLAANYSLNSDIFLNGLIRAGFIDETVNSDGSVARKLHNWEIHNAWAANAEQRSDAARKLAEKRWAKKLKKSGRNAVRMRDAMPAACETQCDAHTVGNAPYPFPYPFPSPKEEAWSEITREDIKDAKKLFKDD
jgi:hypothetical protein